MLNIDQYTSNYYIRTFPDRQEAKVLFHCEVTSTEILEGENYLSNPEGEIICDDMDVLMEKYNVVRLVAGEEEDGE